MLSYDNRLPSALLITMNNGKETLLYCGYTFFYRYDMKYGQKWVCTKFPRCKAFVCVNKDGTIYLSYPEHNHEKKKLYKCPNGRWYTFILCLLFSDACCAVLIQDQIITKHKIRIRDRSLQGCFDSDPFQNIPEGEFVERFRLEKETIRGLIEELSPFIPSSQRNDDVSVATKIIIALTFYASGSYQTLLRVVSLLNVSVVTVSRAIKQVTDALNCIFPKYVKLPDKNGERNEVKKKFYQKFNIPGILGCIDGTHIPIKKPSDHEDVYKNEMGFHSLNLMLICDSDLNILCVDASNPGSTTASGVWQSHPLKLHLKELASNGVQGFLLGDIEYPLSKVMMVPLLNTVEGTPQHLYNLKHATARNTVELCISVLKSRFRCLLAIRPLQYKPTSAEKIVKACCVLHNIANKTGAPVPPRLGSEEDAVEIFYRQQEEQYKKEKVVSYIKGPQDEITDQDLLEGQKLRQALVDGMFRKY